MLRYLALAEGRPLLGRPHTLWSRPVLLLERAWVKTGGIQGRKKGIKGERQEKDRGSLHRDKDRRRQRPKERGIARKREKEREREIQR